MGCWEECAWFNAVVLHIPSTRSGRQETLFVTMMAFPILSASRLAPVRPTPITPNLNFTDMLYSSLIYPSQSFVTLFFPPLPQEIAFLYGRRELRLQTPTSWTSDDESALAFRDSISNSRRTAIKLPIFKCSGFSLTSPVNDSLDLL